MKVSRRQISDWLKMQEINQINTRHKKSKDLMAKVVHIDWAQCIDGIPADAKAVVSISDIGKRVKDGCLEATHRRRACHSQGLIKRDVKA